MEAASTMKQKIVAGIIIFSQFTSVPRGSRLRVLISFCEETPNDPISLGVLEKFSLKIPDVFFAASNNKVNVFFTK